MLDGNRSGTAGRGRQRLRSALVIAEVALAVVPLAGAGLFIASFARVATVDLGMDSRHLLSVDVSQRVTGSDPQARARALSAASALIGGVFDRVRATPGVAAAAVLGNGGAPLSGSWRTAPITAAGREFTNSEDQPQIAQASPEYADVLRLPVRRGRFIAAGDTAGAPRVVVLNEESARRFFGGAEPIGAAVKLDNEWRTVVGIVGNVRVRGPEAPAVPEAYLPHAQVPTMGASIVVRAAGDPADLLPALRRVVLEAVPGVPVRSEVVEAALAGMIAQRKFNMLLIGSFGVLAVLLAAAGIYGVMAYLVTQQTREIGVRMALGASPASVLQMVLGRASRFMAIGIGAGLAGAWILAGAVGAFLFDVKPHDPIVFGAVCLTLAVAGFVAAALPARRASRVDPIVALRPE